MRLGTQTREQRPRPRCHGSEPLLVVSVACIYVLHCLCPTASLIINPHASTLPRRSFAAAGPLPRSSLRMDTKLKNKHVNDSGDDFASFNDFDQGEDDGQQLARDFYQELEQRQSVSSCVSNPEGSKDETYTARGGSGQNLPKDESSKNTIRTVMIQPSSSSGGRSRFTNQPAATEKSSPVSPLFPFLSFLTPAPRPAVSAGLFSGSGTTVYSSGRSIRAEIEILETTMKDNEAKNKQGGGWDGIYVGSPDQLEEVLRVVAISLLVLSAAYVAVDASGVGTDMASWDDAAASAANHLMSLMNDATKDGMSSIMISVGHSEVLLGEEAAWLVKESSDLASSMVEAVRSVEELVLT